MTFVRGSLSQASSRSLPPTSILLPIDTNCDTPRPIVVAASSIATPNAPDWASTASGPGRWLAMGNVESRRGACGSGVGVVGPAADAVGAEQPDAVLAGDREHLVLLRGAVRAGLPE